MLRIYTLAWFPMVLIAVANGSLRQFGYAPYLSELAAHQISCFTAVIFFCRLHLAFVAALAPARRGAGLCGRRYLAFADGRF